MLEDPAVEKVDELEVFRDKLKKFSEYVKYLETILENKRTQRENNLVEKYGSTEM